jgi:hypothetical protein
MCIICFLLGYFVADVISKCGFGREHLSSPPHPGNPGGNWLPTEDERKNPYKRPNDHMLGEAQPPGH